MCVFIARAETRNTGRYGNPLVGIPMPPDGRNLDLRSSLDHGTSSPAARGQVLGQIDLGQPAGEPEPAVVRHDTDLAPPGIEQGFDTASELGLQGVAQLVELAALGPAATGGIARLVRTDVLVAARGQQLAEPIRCKWLFGIGRRREKVLAQRQPLDALRNR